MNHTRKSWLCVAGAAFMLLACGDTMNGPSYFAGEDTMVEGGPELLSVGGLTVSQQEMQNLLARATRAVA